MPRKFPTTSFPRDTHGIVFAQAIRRRAKYVMVRGDVVLGLIDWENSGWCPEHWEYCKAHFAPDLHCGINMNIWVTSDFVEGRFPHETRLANSHSGCPNNYNANEETTTASGNNSSDDRKSIIALMNPVG
ncbi:hypothetical protein B0H13DRAFT_1926934 [Mycena leptocephala]|nr:hypothetical protein B0H13DRAFT_1926934 [Mycena leptocephala]